MLPTSPSSSGSQPHYHNLAVMSFVWPRPGLCISYSTYVLCYLRFVSWIRSMSDSGQSTCGVTDCRARVKKDGHTQCLRHAPCMKEEPDRRRMLFVPDRCAVCKKLLLILLQPVEVDQQSPDYQATSQDGAMFRSWRRSRASPPSGMTLTFKRICTWVALYGLLRRHSLGSRLGLSLLVSTCHPTVLPNPCRQPSRSRTTSCHPRTTSSHPRTTSSRRRTTSSRYRTTSCHYGL